MLEWMGAWFQTVHKHLNSELSKLTQMGIPGEDALILLSKEVIIMFNCFYAIRRKHMDFMVKRVGVEYMVHCIWLSLQVHALMDEFVKDRMKYNPAISAAFVWFLTKQTGSNIRAGLGSQLLKMEERLKALESAAKEAVKEAKEASKQADTAGTNSNAVKTSLKQLYEKNTSLKK
jgi:hypothetical protein